MVTPVSGAPASSTGVTSTPAAQPPDPALPQETVGEAIPEVRERISAAARALFADRGYDSTTVDAIAERAGIARRTFFRYFRSKDDAIFPDHERISQAVLRHLESATDVSPLEAVCGGARVIFNGYLDDVGVAIERYRVARSVPALRDREIASVSQYTRIFRRYLTEKYRGEADAELRAGVIAGAVVGAHNHVLRTWLRSGGDHDPLPDLDHAFAWVMATFESSTPRKTGGRTATGAKGPGAETRSGGRDASEAPFKSDDDVVVAVFRAGQPLDDVVERISRSL
jgi:AcrR family transcriptional regulator